MSEMEMVPVEADLEEQEDGPAGVDGWRPGSSMKELASDMGSGIASVDDLAKDRKPWEKQPGEGHKAFLAFQIYRDLPIEVRTLVRAREIYAQKVGLKGKGGAGAQTRWAQNWLWGERVDAYDRYLDSKVMLRLRKRRIMARQRQFEQAQAAAEVMSHPITVMKERLAELDQGVRESELRELKDEELIQLGRRTVAVLGELHKAERAALEIADEVGDAPGLQIKGQKLKAILQDRGMVKMMEAVTFEVNQESGTGTGDGSGDGEGDG